MNITTATPVEIDTVLAKIWTRIATVEAEIKGYEKQGREALKCIRHGYTGYQGILDRSQAKIAELEAQLPALEAEANPYEAEFVRRGGWTRAFLCTSNNGHVHKDRNCSTTRLRTQFVWLIDYSGKDEAEVVADAGCIACTVCYPSAPVDVLARPTKIFASPEAKAKAEKEAAKPADCDGSSTWDYPRETARLGYYSGNYGVCSHCNQNITVSSTGKMRKHKPKAAG